jgi:IS30 family transposase
VAPSPPRSPLAELSPRFANNYEAPDRLLSPTHGQVHFIQEQLNAPWKFASVAFQKGTGQEDVVNKSIYKFVRSDADNVIEEV